MKKLVICCFSLFVLFSPIFAQNILIIHTYNHTMPWTINFEKGLNLFTEKNDHNVVYFIESLDISRFEEKKHIENFSDFLRFKYRETHFDAIVGNSAQACDFIEDYIEVAETVPKIYYGTNKFYSAPNILNLETNFDDVTEKTLDLINVIFPKLQEIVLISGDFFISQTIQSKLLSFIELHNLKPLRILEKYTYAELKKEVSLLSSTSAVFYVPVVIDNNKTPMIPQRVLSELTTISPAPFFTLWDTLVGTGCIGGHVISAEKVAEETIREALYYLKNGVFSKKMDISSSVVDWNAMRNYSLLTSAIPMHTQIIHKPTPFYLTHLKLLVLIANIILLFFVLMLIFGINLIIKSNKRLNHLNEDLKEARKKAENIAQRDPLTNLFNRRALEPLIEYEQKWKKRYETEISLMCIDIDYFKKVNDTHGHDVGDVILKIVAETLSKMCRITDTVARWGGEEFLVLLPHTNKEQAFYLAEKIRSEIKNLVIPECTPITVSIGVAENYNNESFEDWFKKTDEALYKAKNSGRDKVIVAAGLTLQRTDTIEKQDLLVSLLSWKNEYSVGVDTFDTQHHELFVTFNKIVNAVMNTKGKKIISDLIHSLFTQTQDHFLEEEKYLFNRNCSVIVEHKKEHTRLLDYVSNIIIKFDEDSISAFDFGSFVYDEIVVKHIVEFDKKSFKDILK